MNLIFDLKIIAVIIYLYFINIPFILIFTLPKFILKLLIIITLIEYIKGLMFTLLTFYDIIYFPLLENILSFHI